MVGWFSVWLVEEGAEEGGEAEDRGSKRRKVCLHSLCGLLQGVNCGQRCWQGILIKIMNEKKADKRRSNDG